MKISFQFKGSEVWQAQIADCARAQKYIDLENYIFTDDKVGRRFIDVLVERAQTGVRVRILLDMYGSAELYLRGASVRELREAGIELRFFNSIAKWRVHNFTHLLSRRDHRKFLIIDDSIAHVGSSCVASYMENWPEANARLKGELAALRESFEILWQSASRVRLPRKTFNFALHTGISYLSSSPHIGNRRVHRALVRAIRNARERVELVTPYFVPTMRLRRALERALERGVEVSLVIPRVADVGFLDYANYEYARSLSGQGASVYLHPLMVHSKYTLVDGRWGMLGSANLDNLSMLSNYEHVLVGENIELISVLSRDFERLKNESLPPDKYFFHPSLAQRVFGLLLRPFHRFL